MSTALKLSQIYVDLLFGVLFLLYFIFAFFKINLQIILFFYFRNRINTYRGYTSVMHTFIWYSPLPSAFILTTPLYSFVLVFMYFFIINRHAMKVYAFNFFNFVSNFIIYFQYVTVFKRKRYTFSSVIKLFYVSNHLR